MLVDTPEATRSEIVNFITERAKTIGENIKDSDSNLSTVIGAICDSLLQVASEVKTLKIIDISKPQHWESFDEMMNMAILHAGKHILLEDKVSSFLLGISFDNNRMLYIDGVTPINKVEAQRIFSLVQARRGH